MTNRPRLLMTLSFDGSSRQLTRCHSLLRLLRMARWFRTRTPGFAGRLWIEAPGQPATPRD